MEEDVERSTEELPETPQPLKGELDRQRNSRVHIVDHEEYSGRLVSTTQKTKEEEEEEEEEEFLYIFE